MHKVDLYRQFAYKLLSQPSIKVEVEVEAVLVVYSVVVARVVGIAVSVVGGAVVTVVGRVVWSRWGVEPPPLSLGGMPDTPELVYRRTWG